MKDFNSNPELVFAGRCLDWNGGKLILPESLRPYMPDGAQVIEHNRRVFARAVSPFLKLNEMDDDPRVQIYRTSMDSFLTWLCLVASALDRKLFFVADIQDVGYWVAKIQSEVVLHPFIVAYGYQENITKLIRYYRRKRSPYKNWVFPINLPFRPNPNVEESAASPDLSFGIPEAAEETGFCRNIFRRAVSAILDARRRLTRPAPRNVTSGDPAPADQLKTSKSAAA